MYGYLNGAVANGVSSVERGEDRAVDQWWAGGWGRGGTWGWRGVRAGAGAGDVDGAGAGIGLRLGQL